MKLKSLLKFSQLLSMSHDEAVSAYHTGLIDLDQLEAYNFLWTWGVPRYSGQAAVTQDLYANTFGHDALLRRYARVGAWIKAAKTRSA